jgi:DNA-binding CsgD family transcriptional regulator
MSAKTVECHLPNVYRELAIHSREEIVTALAARVPEPQR